MMTRVVIPTPKPPDPENFRPRGSMQSNSVKARDLLDSIPVLEHFRAAEVDSIK